MINWIQLGPELVAENDDFCSPFALWYLLKGATVVPETHYQRPSAKVYDFCVLEQLQTLHSQPSPRNSRGSLCWCECNCAVGVFDRRPVNNSEK